MQLRTEIVISSFSFHLSHQNRILTMGSCFAESISEKLENAGFSVDCNPFGIIYNPRTLSNGIRNLLHSKKYTSSDLFEHKGLYHSFSHHSRFSGISQIKCTEKINMRINESSAFLRKSNILIITFGTAHVYHLKSNGQIVSNCHKLPDRLFERKRLTVEDIVSDWTSLIAELSEANPELKIIFTVSPIRHWKDGAHENQLSKSILLLAVDELIRGHDHCYYFPSYELLLDDLRDYRFYNEDMIHPSPVAINYIWERFSEACFNKTTRGLIAEWQNIQQALNHRPFNPESEEHQLFLKKTQERLEIFLKNNATFDHQKNQR